MTQPGSATDAQDVPTPPVHGGAAAQAGGAACPLCTGEGGVLVLRTPQWRLIRAEEAGFPAFYRVIWNAHVAEFSDLSSADRATCMDAVAQVERRLREHLQPTKVNIAALGNMVPHLHWHVIARFEWDSHFPNPVWAAAVRPVDAAQVAQIESRRAVLEDALRTVFRA